MTSRAAHHLHLDRRYLLPADVDQVWDQLADLERYPVWWRWLREFEVEGGDLRVGTRLRAWVVPPVPYRFRVEVRFVAVEPPHHIAAEVSGDLTGPAELWLHDRADGCEVHVRWRVEMRKASMRHAASVARPAMVWGHDQVVAWTVRRFRGVLR